MLSLALAMQQMRGEWHQLAERLIFPWTVLPTFCLW